MNQSKHSTTHALQPCLVSFPSDEEKYKQLLQNTVNSTGMSSGYVVLSPGETVGMHNTDDYEEMLIPLAGTGKLILPDLEDLEFNPGCVLYNPPQTMHDVVNIG